MTKLELQPKQYPIGSLFDYTQIQGFIIPEFQRPYTWDIEQCRQLWEDIYDAYIIAKKGQSGDIAYFLGSIIVYSNPTTPQKLTIIDGQQRITSILLLLRAIYTSIGYKLDKATDPEYKTDLQSRQIELDKLLYIPIGNNILSNKNEGDKSKPKLDRLNISPENDYFNIIMKVGSFTDNTDDNKDIYTAKYVLDEYYRIKSNNKANTKDNHLNKILHSHECLNYAFFMDTVEKIDFSELDEIITFITKLCFVLVIKTESPESALDIFDILNNRGMQLADADIFKNIISKSFNDQKITTLNEQWLALDKILKTDPPIEMTLDQVFKLYMFALRSTHHFENKSKEPRLRDFFTKDKLGKEALHDANIIQTLKSMIEFTFQVLNLDDVGCEANADSAGSSSSSVVNIASLIDDEVKYDICMLNKYIKNGSWINLISTFWYCYHSMAENNPSEFKIKFQKFIRFSTSVLFLKSILVGSSSDADIPQLCENLAMQAAQDGYIDNFIAYFTTNLSPQNDRILENRQILNGELSKKDSNGKCRLDLAREKLAGDTSKLNHLVLLYAYHFQDNVPNHKTQPIIQAMTVEHILPQKWEAHYGSQWRKECHYNENLINDYVEHLGNKIILARERNIRAAERDFPSKIRIYKDNKKANSKLTIELEAFVEAHKNSKKWTKKDVDERTTQMIDVIINFIRSGIEGGIV